MGCFEKLNLFFLRGLFHPILPRFFTYAPGTVTKGKGCRDLTPPGGAKTKKSAHRFRQTQKHNDIKF